MAVLWTGRRVSPVPWTQCWGPQFRPPKMHWMVQQQEGRCCFRRSQQLPELTTHTASPWDCNTGNWANWPSLHSCKELGFQQGPAHRPCLLFLYLGLLLTTNILLHWIFITTVDLHFTLHLLSSGIYKITIMGFFGVFFCFFLNKPCSPMWNQKHNCRLREQQYIFSFSFIYYNRYSHFRFIIFIDVCHHHMRFHMTLSCHQIS